MKHKSPIENERIKSVRNGSQKFGRGPWLLPSFSHCEIPLNSARKWTPTTRVPICLFAILPLHTIIYPVAKFWGRMEASAFVCLSVCLNTRNFATNLNLTNFAFSIFGAAWRPPDMCQFSIGDLYFTLILVQDQCDSPSVLPCAAPSQRRRKGRRIQFLLGCQLLPRDLRLHAALPIPPRRRQLCLLEEAGRGGGGGRTFYLGNYP